MQRSRKGVWFITGTTTGFDRVLVEEILKAGSVAATAWEHVTLGADFPENE
jgi:hypothetical protein